MKKVFHTKKFKVALSRQFIIIVFIILILIIMGSAPFYIYKILIKALTYSEEVALLKYEVAPEIYDMDKFKLVIQNLEQKQDQDEIITWSDVKNPFQGLEQTLPSPEISPQYIYPRTR